MALKNCKECNKQISSDLKKCIHCGKDQRSFWSKHPIISLFICIWLLGIFVNVFSDNKSSKSTSNHAPAEPIKKEPQVFPTSQMVSNEMFDIAVEKIDYKDIISSNFLQSRASDGATYVCIIWFYKNISREPLGFLDFPHISLISPDGVKYSSDINASATYATIMNTNSKVLSNLNPGIRVFDAQVFEVSKEQLKKKGWKLLVKSRGEFYFSI